MLTFESTWGRGVSQVKAALSAIGRYRGVSQLYCRKSRFNGPLSLEWEALGEMAPLPVTLHLHAGHFLLETLWQLQT